VSQAVESLADHFDLSDDDRRELLPSGRQHRFNNRVAWAISYLKKSGLLEPTRRSHFRITKRGVDVLGESPARIDIGYLERYPEFVAFRSRQDTSENGATAPSKSAQPSQEDEQTPEEAMEQAHQRLRNELASELIQQIMSCSPSFFERLVIDLLVRMGYGGSRKDAGEAIGKSGDGGIDGIIKEDRLGLDVIYVQAKRWDGVVGRPEIQKFVGALQGQRARKGIFITTSGFTADAIRYATMIENKVVLMDGERLAKLMIANNVGVALAEAYEVS
jgi:restriction system protein